MSTPPVISALPDVPATSDPQFEIKAPALFNAIKNTFIGEVNSVASWINAGSWLTNPLAVGSGGTGLATIPAGRILYGNDTSAVSTNANFVFNGNNLGIGTTTPLSKLHVNGLVTQWGYLQGFAAVGVGTDFTNYESLTCAHAGVNGAQFISSGVGTGTIRDFKWVTWNGSNAPILMTLTAGGYLGINTTNPIARIDVVTDVNHTAQGAVRVRNVSTGANGMSLYYTGDSASDYAAVFGSTGTGSTSYAGGQTGIVGTVKNIPLTVIRNNAFHSIFDTSGNLGINTATPAARIHAISTTEQLRLGYDVSNYTSLTTDSSGNFTISPTGGGIRINQAPAGAAGAATGTFLRLNLNGTNYKIALLANA